MPDRSTRIIRYFITLLIPLFIVTGTVRVLTTDSYLAYEYAKAGFPPDPYGFTAGQRLELASTNVHFVRGHLAQDTLSKENLAGKLLYTLRETDHMLDVRKVFQVVIRLWQFAFLMLVLLGFFLWRKEQKTTLARALQWGGTLTAGIVLTIALLAFFAWQTWFNLFHRFFFEAGSWLFDYTDTLIRLFPLEFWSDATYTIILLSLAGGLAVWSIGNLWRISMDAAPAKIY